MIGTTKLGNLKSMDATLRDSILTSYHIDARWDTRDLDTVDIRAYESNAPDARQVGAYVSVYAPRVRYQEVEAAAINHSSSSVHDPVKETLVTMALLDLAVSLAKTLTVAHLDDAEAELREQKVLREQAMQEAKIRDAKRKTLAGARHQVITSYAGWRVRVTLKGRKYAPVGYLLEPITDTPTGIQIERTDLDTPREHGFNFTDIEKIEVAKRSSWQGSEARPRYQDVTSSFLTPAGVEQEA